MIHQLIADTAADHGIPPAVLDYHVRDLHGTRPEELEFAQVVDECVGCHRPECLAVLEDEFGHTAPAGAQVPS